MEDGLHFVNLTDLICRGPARWDSGSAVEHKGGCVWIHEVMLHFSPTVPLVSHAGIFGFVLVPVISYIKLLSLLGCVVRELSGLREDEVPQATYNSNYT